jgi:hypothetical protein
MGEIIEFHKPNSNSTEINPKELIGKMLMLNSGMAPKFQCGGFSVNPSRMVDVVTERTQLMPIRAAVASGLLVDVSNNDIVKKGINLKNSSASRIMEEDTDKKAFMGRDSLGRLFVIVPKDDVEKQKFEQQIAEKGNITFNPLESNDFTGFTSGITEEELKSGE